MIDKEYLNNPHSLGRNKERNHPPKVVCYHQTINMVDHRLKFPLDITSTKMVGLLVKGGMRVYQCNRISTYVAFHQRGGYLLLKIILQNQ